MVRQWRFHLQAQSYLCLIYNVHELTFSITASTRWICFCSSLYSTLPFPNPHLSRSVSPVPPSLSPPPFLDNEMLAPASLLSSKSTI